MIQQGDNNVQAKDAAAGAHGAAAAGHGQAAAASDRSAAGTGKARVRAISQASTGAQKRWRATAVLFAVILIVALGFLVTGTTPAVIGVVIGAIGVAVSLFRLYKGA